MSLTEAELVAYHEAGHAVTRLALYGEQAIDFVAVVTIDPQRRERYKLPAETPMILGATKPNPRKFPLSILARSRRPKLRWTWVRRALLDAHGVFCCAGLAAEHLVVRTPLRDRLPIVSSDLVDASEGSAGDLEDLGDFARVFELRPPQEHRLVYYSNCALEILRERLRAVETLTQALLDGGTLEGHEVERIVAHASRARKTKRTKGGRRCLTTVRPK